MTWNEDRERLIAAAELGDATPQIAADLLVAARRRAFEAEAAHAWIKTSEHPPHADTIVIGYYADNKHFPNRIGLARFSWSMNDPSVMSHWQPMPEPPK